jgi:hypothetical protein
MQACRQVWPTLTLTLSRREEGQGLGDGSPGGLDATSSRHNDGMIHDGIIEIALFIPGHIVRLGMPVLICGPDANCMLPWPGVPVEVPSSPCL